MIIARPIPIPTAPVAAGDGAEYLLTPSPKEVWVADAVGSTTIDVDLSVAEDVDTFFLGFTNATAAATWQIQIGTGVGVGLVDLVPAGTAMRAADSLGPHHALAVLDAPVNGRYFRITTAQTGAEPLQAGILILSKAFVAPYDLGGGREPIDTTPVTELTDGGFNIGDGAIKARLEWKFVDLSPADRRALWAIIKSVGKSSPVLVVEQLSEDAGLNEEMHYGLFDRFEPYVREAPGSTRWALSMKQWL